MGFLTEINNNDVFYMLQKIKENNFKLEDRLMLAIDIDELPENKIVLNDVVITRQALSRIIDIKVYINDVFANKYTGDGVIISTPTNSTAYNLSTGGPVIYPLTNNIVITPICPHSLYTRPLIISANDVIKVEMAENQHSNVMYTLDGQFNNEFKSLEIKKSQYKTQLIKVSGHDFYTTFRKKFSIN